MEQSSSHEAWNWDSIYELVKTLQMNPRRLDEIVKLTKFFRRILSFYRPLSLQFSEMPNVSDGAMSIQVSVILEVLDLLFQHTEGLKLLEEHKFFSEIGDCLVQIIQVSIYTQDSERSELSQWQTHGFFSFFSFFFFFFLFSFFFFFSFFFLT